MKRLVGLGIILMVITLGMILVGCGSKDKGDVNSNLSDDAQEDTVEDEVIVEPLESDSDENTTSSNDVEPGELYKKITIIADKLNVRSEVSTDSEIVDKVYQDSVYEVIQFDRDDEAKIWYKIQTENDIVGWIAGWYVQEADLDSEITTEPRVLTDTVASDTITMAIESVGMYSIRTDESTSAGYNMTYSLNPNTTDDTIVFVLTKGLNDSGFSTVISCEITVDESSVTKTYESNIESNGGISEIGVIDLVSGDGYIELYIKEGDLADRTEYTFYRLTGDGLTQYGSMTGDILALSGDGKIYYWGGNIYEPFYNTAFTNFDLVLSYYDVYLKTYVDTNQSVGKTIVADREMIIYASYVDVFDGAPIEYADLLSRTEETRIRILQPGESFTVISLDQGIQIETEFGEIGWIGGFHMVWS